jgi:hypothetical protein
MAVVIGIWFALAGGLAVLAGLTGIHRAHRLRRRGRRFVDSAFVAVGALFIFIGTALAALGY